jgi:hypothetical protein
MSKPKHLRGTQEQLEVAAKDPTPKSRPACRDCADLAVGGICPNSGRPCQTKQPAARVPDGCVVVDRGALNMVISALRRDAEQGKSVRGEMADALSAAPSQRVPDGVPTAVREAVAAIYFEDGADYIRALWSVVRALSPTIAKLLEDDAQAAFDMAEAMLSAAPSQQAPVQGEPVYQYQLHNGSWIDQKKDSYEYNVRYGQATVRVLYTTPNQASKPMIYDTPMAEFEAAICKVGVVAACEWFGYAADSEFTKETMRVLAERHHKIGEKQ